MLFDQLQKALKRTVNSKIAIGPSAGRFESSSQTELTKGLYSRLHAVEKALEDNPGISSIEAPDIESLPSYCRDTGLWNAALISKTYDVSKEPESVSSYSLLRDCGEVLVLLVGSHQNLTGSAPSSSSSVSPSFRVDDYLLSVGDAYWRRDQKAMKASNANIEQTLAGVLNFCGTCLAYTPVKMLAVLFRVFSVFEISDDILAQVYAGSACIFTGKPRLLVTGSPLYVALPE